MLAGINYARYPICITLDDDLQNPPSELRNLIREFINVNADVLYAIPQQYSAKPYRRIGSLIHLLVLRKVSRKSKIKISSYRVFKREILDYDRSITGSPPNIDALLSWQTDNIATTFVKHNVRDLGKSNYNLKKLLKFFSVSFYYFNVNPLKFVFKLGVIIFLFGIFLFLFVIYNYLKTGGSVPGFTFLATTLILTSSLIILVLGLIGNYIGQVYFNLIGKPIYKVSKKINLDDNSF